MARRARTPTPELDTAVDNWDRLRFKSLVKEHKEAELELKILARKINKLLNEEVS